jgi:hypothetical protein
VLAALLAAALVLPALLTFTLTHARLARLLALLRHVLLQLDRLAHFVGVLAAAARALLLLAGLAAAACSARNPRSP